MFALVGYFFLYSFFGWIGDTTVRSARARKLIIGSFFSFPICPVYGFGALLTLGLARWVGSAPFVLQFLVYGLALAMLEYVTGIFILTIFHRRLWKYVGGFFNVGGFTTASYAVLWGILGVLLVKVIHPFLQSSFQ